MADRKKILYVITKGNFGGAQRYVFDLATNLPKDQFDVAVTMGEGEILEKKLRDSDIRTIRTSSLQRDVNPLKEIRAFFELFKIFKEEKPDVVHLNSSKAGFLGSIAGRFAGIQKIVFTGHGWAFNENRSPLSKLFFLILHLKSIVLSHKTIAVSEKTYQEIAKFPLVKNKLISIHNGIPHFEMLPQEEARRELGAQINADIWIGTISELHKNKGLDFTLRAFARVAKDRPGIAFIIIGDGEEREPLEKLVLALGIQKQVVFAGFRDNAKKYLKAFDIFTLTSRTEAFPYVPLEAGLAELPVVASSVGGIPEMIENEKNGFLVEPSNVDAISEALLKLIENTDLRQKLGSNLKNKVESEFSLQKMIDETLEVYL